MFNLFKRSAIYDSEFEQLLTYDIAVPTDKDIGERIEECKQDMEKRGLSGFSPRPILEKDKAGSLYLHLHRVQQLRSILRSHGWQQEKSS
jgi:hypothetical protein